MGLNDLIGLLVSARSLVIVIMLGSLLGTF